MKLVLTWIAVALSVVACATQYNPKPVEPTAFEQVCTKALQEYGALCKDLEAPIVVYSQVVDDLEYYGFYYPGEPYIFVNPYGDHVEKTLIHEIVHYVLHELDLVIERCESEEIAREWASELTDTEVDATWRIRYRCGGGFNRSPM